MEKDFARLPISSSRPIPVSTSKSPLATLSTKCRRRRSGETSLFCIQKTMNPINPLKTKIQQNIEPIRRLLFIIKFFLARDDISTRYPEVSLSRRKSCDPISLIINFPLFEKTVLILALFIPLKSISIFIWKSWCFFINSFIRGYPPPYFCSSGKT